MELIKHPEFGEIRTDKKNGGEKDKALLGAIDQTIATYKNIREAVASGSYDDVAIIDLIAEAEEEVVEPLLKIMQGRFEEARSHGKSEMNA